MRTLGNEYFRDNGKIAVTHSVWSPTLTKHGHLFFEIAFITKGSGDHILNNTCQAVSPGSLFLISPKSEHTLVAREEPFEWINILFFPSAISPSLIDMVGTNDILKALLSGQTLLYSTESLTDIEIQDRNRELQYIFKEMLREFEEQKAGYENILKGYLEILLVKIFRAYFYTPNTDTEIVQKVLNYLQEKSLGNNISAAELAKRAFFSPEYFRKLFKKETGIPLAAFIRGKRIEMAKRLIEETDLSIKEIMEKVGFFDTKSFYTAFKKAYGKTPGSYRS